jgi:hypothetical protein
MVEREIEEEEISPLKRRKCSPFLEQKNLTYPRHTSLRRCLISLYRSKDVWITWLILARGETREAMGFCDNPLESWVIGMSFFGNDQVGIIKLIVGLLYILMAAITIGWINIQARNARNGDNDAVKSVIFPIFTIMMWVSAFTSISVALVILFVPVDLTSRNDSNARWLYPTVFTLQHIVLEGVAFLLMQKGCGKYAAWNASKLMAIWAAITLTANVIGYSPGYKVSIVALLTWDASLLIFYFLLWILPQNRLFRRPAAIPYAKFWFFFRVVEITLYSMSQVSDPLAAQIGRCGYVFGPLFVFTIFQPIIMYWTLLADSR